MDTLEQDLQNLSTQFTVAYKIGKVEQIKELWLKIQDCWIKIDSERNLPPGTTKQDWFIANKGLLGSAKYI